MHLFRKWDVGSKFLEPTKNNPASPSVPQSERRRSDWWHVPLPPCHRQQGRCRLAAREQETDLMAALSAGSLRDFLGRGRVCRFMIMKGRGRGRSERGALDCNEQAGQARGCLVHMEGDSFCVLSAAVPLRLWLCSEPAHLVPLVLPATIGLVSFLAKNRWQP